MHIARCLFEKEIYYGIIQGDTIQLQSGTPFTSLHYLKDVPFSAVTLLSPCQPSKIIAYGINYAPHAKELQFRIPEVPLLFLKPSTSVIGPNDPVILPSSSKQVEFEGELAVIIGKQCRNVVPEEAPSCVYGYTCINDVTARDLQKKDIQFTRSKSFDTFAPLGPWITTDIDPNALTIQTFLNDTLQQHASTSDMIRSVPELVSFASQIMTLLPGDVIATGTPAGVGKIKTGDTVTIHIEEIGSLTNSVQ